MADRTAHKTAPVLRFPDAAQRAAAWCAADPVAHRVLQDNFRAPRLCGAALKVGGSRWTRRCTAPRCELLQDGWPSSSPISASEARSSATTSL